MGQSNETDLARYRKMSRWDLYNEMNRLGKLDKMYKQLPKGYTHLNITHALMIKYLDQNVVEDDGEETESEDTSIPIHTPAKNKKRQRWDPRDDELRDRLLNKKKFTFLQKRCKEIAK